MVKFYDSEIRVDCAVESDNFSLKLWVLMHGPKTATWYLARITKNRRTQKKLDWKFLIIKKHSWYGFPPSKNFPGTQKAGSDAVVEHAHRRDAHDAGGANPMGFGGGRTHLCHQTCQIGPASCRTVTSHVPGGQPGLQRAVRKM